MLNSKNDVTTYIINTFLTSLLPWFLLVLLVFLFS
jgi:hypothetical protein